MLFPSSPRRGGPTPPRGLPGRANEPMSPADWFPARLTAEAGTTPGGAVQYVGYEVWIDPDGATVELVGGRLLTAAQPGVFYDRDTTVLPALAMARLGPGSGGRYWELWPFVTETGSGSGVTAGDATNGGAPRCSGTIVSEVEYRSAVVSAQLVQYSRLRTMAYDSTGCIVVTFGDWSSQVIGCVDCPDDGGSGSGPHSGGSVTTTCCDLPVPSTLFATLGTGHAVALVYDAGFVFGAAWVSADFDYNGKSVYIWLTCTTGSWVLSSGSHSDTCSASASPGSDPICDPALLIVFTLDPTTACGATGATTFTITDTGL